MCDTCTWPDYYYSPWKSDYNGSRPASIVSSGGSKSCHTIQRKQDTSTAIQESNCYKSEGYNEDLFIGALCEFRECRISVTEICVFPFKFGGRWYDKCTRAGAGDENLPAWCSTKVDSDGVHIPGNEGLCPANCPVSDCPVGFWPHLSTCLQPSSSVPGDAKPSVEEAEASCMSQGGRLYQPRSTRTLQLLKRRETEFFHNGNSAATGILSWDPDSVVALGMTTDPSDPFYPLTYRDNSGLPAGLIAHNKGVAWSSGFPTGTDTCGHSSMLLIT